MPSSPSPAAGRPDGTATPAGEVTSHDVPSDRVLLAFVRLWALALLLHLLLATNNQLDGFWNVATVALAFAVLLKPGSMRLFATLLIAQLGEMVTSMPWSPNHWMLDGFVGLTILCVFAVQRRLDLDALRRAIPGVRVVLLVAYAAAALSKYNTTFLDPVTSCATALASRASIGLTERLPLDPLWLTITIGIETLVPILLVIPQTRRHGVRIGMLFHLVLTLSPAIEVQDFTATLVALFFLFLSTDDAESVLDRLRALGARSSVVRDVRDHPRIAATVAFVVAGLAGHLHEPVAAATVQVISKLVLIGVVVAAAWSWPERRPAGPLGGVRWRHVPLILLTALWAANPYLGLRTTGSFTMFSGLRTEGTEANHLFLPSVHLTDWQTDLVYIQSSNDSSLNDAAELDTAIPLLGLRRKAMENPDLVVTGRLHGRLVTFGPDSGQQPWEALTWVESKFSHFHLIGVGDQAFCTD